MKSIRTRAIALLVAGFALAACGSDSASGSNISNNSNSNNKTGDTVRLSGSTANHLAAAAFDGIPASAIQNAKSNLRIFYGHTSHGSQLMTGLEMLQSGGFSDGPSITEEGGDLGSVDWVAATRDALGADGNGFNVVIWSWCGQVSEDGTDAIDAYLADMEQLQKDYPSVAFVYMTGHTDGGGDEGTLHTNNDRIRQWCSDHGRWLYDFEDIESWDPANSRHADTSDSCEWCSTWCDENACPAAVTSGDFDDLCAHSNPLNCYLKGKAFWWLLARMAGWSG